MDNSVVATKYPGLYNISTTDFFYPLVEDPYLQGRIAACNVLSDLFAMGVTEVDTVLMLLAVSSDMGVAERDIVTAAMIRGFTDTAAAAATAVTGGQTVMNPWPIIGGVAITLRHESEFILPGGAVAGDVLVLTKPLGTQVAVNLWQWRDRPAKWDAVARVASAALAARAYDVACDSMGRLNLAAARAMHTHGAHGATDVTGFGILGHAANMAKHSVAAVDFVLHTLPVIDGMVAVEDAIGGTFGLRAGRSAETSGGLLVALPSPAAAAAYCATVAAADGRPAWIIGAVVAGSGAATIAPDVVFLPV